MDTRKLRYFMAVAEEMSFGKAARRLGMTQPALSRAIKDLEEKVGTDLFDRSGNQIKLTRAGDLLLPKVDEALMVLEEGFESIRQECSNNEAVIDVGYLPSLFHTFLGDAFSIFSQTFPQTRINPHSMNAGPLFEELRAGRLDVAFVGSICPELEKEFDPFFLYEAGVAVVVARHHPLAGKGAIDLSELSESPVVTLSEKEFPGRHGFLMATCREAGFTPKVYRETDSLSTAMATVSSSDAFSIMPLDVKTIAPPHVAFLDLKHPKTGIEFHALVKRDESRKMILTLLQECRRIIQSRPGSI